MKDSRRFPLLALLATSLLPLLAVAAPTPQTTIKGTVKSSSGSPLEGIAVSAQSTAGNYLFATTISDGSYQMTNAVAGTYLVSACDCGASAKYPMVYYPNVWSFDVENALAAATPVEVLPNKTSTADFTLSEGGWIHLTLRTPSGSPIDAGTSPTEQASFGNLFVAVGDDALNWNQGATSSGDHNDGTYTSRPIPVGRTVFVEARPDGQPYAPLFYPKATSLDQSTPIPIGSPIAFDVTMTLSDGGHVVSGKIDFDQTPQQINYRYCQIYDLFGDDYVWAYSDPDGTCTLRGVRDGIYGASVGAYIKDALGNLTSPYAYLPPIHVSGGDVSFGTILVDTAKPFGFSHEVDQPVHLFATAGSVGSPFTFPIWPSDYVNAPIPFHLEAEDPMLLFNPATGTLVDGSGATTIRVRGDASAVGPGEYHSILDIFDDSGQGTPSFVPVRLTVYPQPTGAAKLETNPRALEFTSAGRTFDAVPLDLTNTGTAPTDWCATSSLVELFPAEGTLAPGETAHLVAAVDQLYYVPDFGSETATVDFFASGIFSNSLPASATVAPDPVAVTKSPIPAAERLLGLRNYTIPIISSKAPGAAASMWSSDVSIGNVSAIGTASGEEGASTAAQGEPAALPAFFTPLGSKNGENSLLVDGAIEDEVVPLADAVSTVFDKPGGIGVLEVRADSAQRYGVWSRSATPSADGAGSYGQEVPALESGSILSGGQSGTLPVLLGGTFRSNIILVETSGQAADVTIDLHDASGASVGSQVVRSLAAFEQSAANNILVNTGSGATLASATIKVTGAGKVGVLASVVDNGTNDPTTMLHRKIAPRTSGGRILIPVVAHADGVGGTVWRSDVWFTNVSGSPITFSASYSPEGGSGIVSGASHTVAPGAILVLPDVAASEFAVSSGKGSALFDVTSGDPASLYTTSRTYNLSSSGTFGQGVWPVESDREIRLADTGGLALFGLEKTSRTRTNLIVVETSGAPVTVTIEPVLAAYGQDSISIVKELAPWQFLQLNDVLAAAGYPEGFTNLALRVKVTAGTGSVAAFASMVDSATGDGTTVPSYR